MSNNMTQNTVSPQVTQTKQIQYNGKTYKPCTNCTKAGFAEEYVRWERDTEGNWKGFQFDVNNQQEVAHQHKGDQKTAFKKSIYSLGKIRSMTLDEVNLTVEKAKQDKVKGGYFEINGDGYFGPEGERMVDLVWKEKLGE